MIDLYILLQNFLDDRSIHSSSFTQNYKSTHQFSLRSVHIYITATFDLLVWSSTLISWIKLIREGVKGDGCLPNFQITIMAGPLKNFTESIISMVGEELVDYGLERVTGNKDSKFKLETLQRSLNSLSDKACDINEQIRHGEKSGKKKRKREVENWLKEVTKIESELGVLQNEVQEEGFLSRFFGEDRVSKLQARVSELVDQSHHFGELLLDSNEMRGEPLLTPRLVGEALEKNAEVIWKWLVSDEVKSIGIYGMGGVGKTTLAKHINNRLLNQNQCSVYWVTVSQVFTINKLQSDIAKAIGLDISEEDSEDKRAGRLNQALSQKDFVLILDDVWNDIDLEKMGDPLGVEGCKLIVTTRSLTVCRRIDCQETIKVETLQTDESWTLFRETLGERTAITSEVEEIAMSLAKECDGLPLGIIVLAKSMKGVTDIHEWRNVYDEICESPMELDDMKDKVFRVLEYSFNRLDPEFHGKRRRNGLFTKLQLCFLYCSLYPEDYEIKKDNLIRKFISEGLVDRRKSLEKQLDQGETMLSKLENLCLLESMPNVMGLVSVRMHDLVRVIALKIARESPKYKVFAGLGLKEIPNEEEWTEDVDKISLMNNEIEEIPQGMAPNCPKLATLFLNDNPLESIPESFFAKMSGLCVLDLSYSSVRELPNSLSDLESLDTLLLKNCINLVSVPYFGKLKALRELDLSGTSIRELPNSLSDLESLNTLLLKDSINLVSVPYLGKLKALRELDLSGTSIRDLPKGVEYLINLKILLFRCSKKLKLPPEDFSLISPYLQHLELPLEIVAPLHEIVKFKQLKKFVGRFSDFSDFYRFQSETGGFISKFYYNLGSKDDLYYARDPSFCENTLSMKNYRLRRVEGEDGMIILPENIEVLRIEKCKGQSSCILDDFKSFPSFLNILSIVDCEGIESILNINDQLMEETAICVGTVFLDRLPDLKGLINWEVGGAPPPSPPPKAAMVFSYIRKLYISGCNNMKTLGFPLPFLEPTSSIKIMHCGEVEELIQRNEGEADDDKDVSEFTYSLPKLKRLWLQNLPKLESICKARINCESLEHIDIIDCPRVKKLPLFLPSSSYWDGQVINYSPPPALKKIIIDKQLWESLEWDDPTHKHLLQPFVKYIPQWIK